MDINNESSETLAIQKFRTTTKGCAQLSATLPHRWAAFKYFPPQKASCVKFLNKKMRHKIIESNAKCQLALFVHVKYCKQNLSLSCYFIYKPSMSQQCHTAAEKAKTMLRHLPGVLHRKNGNLPKPFHTLKASSKVPAAQGRCGQVGGNPKEQKNVQTSRIHGLQRKFERTGII